MNPLSYPIMSFFAHGRPAPGGSKTAFPVRNRKTGALIMKEGRPVIAMVDAGGAANARWKKAVKWQAKSFMRGAKPFTCPCKVEFIFFLERPMRHFEGNDRSRPLRADAPEHHTQAPDALKFARSTEDALSGICYADDSQNVRLCTEKRWAGPGQDIGCAIKIVLLQESQAQPELIE